MNKYGLALKTPSVQTLIPVMNKSGVMYGFYPITSHSFTGAETNYALSDMTTPLTTVTVDSDQYVKQYMAAVYPLGIAANYQPWASSNLIAPGDGASRWFSMPAESWFLHFSKGTLVQSLTQNMNQVVTLPAVPGAPTVVTPQAMTFNGSISYAALTGGCSFFDFNWTTTFVTTGDMVPLSILPLTNPAGMKATVIGVPTATPNGIMYDSIRIIKTAEDLAPGVYVFTFAITGMNGLSASVTLNLTVA